MAPTHDELEALRQQVAALTARIFRLEQRLGIAAETSRPETARPTATAPQAPPIAPPPSTSSAVPPGLHAVPPATQPFPKRESASLESKIGKVWLNYIGIGAVLAGIGFYLVYAFTNDKIGRPAQVAIGLILGIAIVLWSEAFRRKGHAFFSYSLKAVGIGAMYLSLWGAHKYELIDVKIVFAAMIVVTIATVILAVTQDAQIMALYALIGGFISPVLVSTGKNEEVIFFSYVAILDFGVLVLAALKPWRRLLWGALAGTIVMYMGWWLSYYALSERAITLFFTSLFAAVFAAVPLVTPYRTSSKFPGPSITLTVLPLLNAAFFFLALYGMYSNELVKLTWFALGLAAIYLGISNLFMRRFAEKDTRKVISLLHVAIAIAFITIAVPLKLNAHWITIGWLIESAVLLWISVQTKTPVLRYLGTAALVMGIVRMFVADTAVDTQSLIFNARFATYSVAIVVLGVIIAYGSGKGKSELGTTEQAAIKLAGVVLNVIALIALACEATDYFNRQKTESYIISHQDLSGHFETLKNYTYCAIGLIYGVPLMVVGFWKRSAFIRWQALALLALTIGGISILAWVEAAETTYRILIFIGLGAVLLGISYAYQRDWLKLSPRSSEKSQGTSA